MKFRIIFTKNGQRIPVTDEQVFKTKEEAEQEALHRNARPSSSPDKLAWIVVPEGRSSLMEQFGKHQSLAKRAPKKGK
jgi:hypothetical protein